MNFISILRILAEYNNVRILAAFIMSFFPVSVDIKFLFFEIYHTVIDIIYCMLLCFMCFFNSLIAFKNFHFLKQKQDKRTYSVRTPANKLKFTSTNVIQTYNYDSNLKHQVNKEKQM